jgi:hypothetical protein
MWTNLRRTLATAAAVLAVVGMYISVHASAWNVGDVIVSTSNSAYNVYDNNGNFKETISWASSADGPGDLAGGCAFNSSSNLYATNFSDTHVVKFDGNDPHGVLDIINDAGPSEVPAASSESILFAKNGDFYVGHADGNHNVHRYNSAGVFQQAYAVATELRGSDHIELAADQKTLFYTSEGGRILRFDLSTGTQLSDFANIGGNSFALRLLPPGDGTGGLLVANFANIKLLNAAGTVIRTYDVPGEDSWFALTLDPNGTSFWSGGLNSSNFYRFNILTGAVEVGPINTGAPGGTMGGICVKGEPTVAVRPPVTIHYDPGTNVSHTFMFGTGPGASTLQVTFDQVITGFDLTFTDRPTNQAAVASRLTIFPGYVCTQHADANCHEYVVEEPIPVKDVDYTGNITLENLWQGVYNNTRLLQDPSTVAGDAFTKDITIAGYSGQGVDGRTDGFSGFLKADAPLTATMVTFSSPTEDDLTVYKITRTAVPVKFTVRSTLPPFEAITPLVPRLSVEFCPHNELTPTCLDGVPISPISSVGKSNTENIARYDPGTMQWIYNLDITGLTNVGKYHIVVIDAEGPTTPPKFTADGVFFHLK